jgi:Protein of unknown function (DUF664)
VSQEATDPQTRLLLATLDNQRDHVLGILDGLDEQALRRPVLPSGWDCAGLVHHLALDVERFWFRAVFAGEQGVINGLDSQGNAWQVPSGMPAKSVLDLYRAEIELANAIITSSSLDDAPAWWPGELFGSWRLHDLREMIVHVITETACHAGHLDAARELIDGRKWLVLTEE